MKTLKNKRALCVLFTVITLCMSSQSIGEIRGIVKDKNDLQPVPYATVKILQGTQLIGGTQTDEDGRYNYKPLVPGTYELIITEAGHQTQPVNKIKVIPNEATYVDVKLTANTFSEIEVLAPPVDYSNTGVDKTMYNQVSIDALDLNRNAGYERGDIQGAVEAITTDVLRGPDGELHFRGSRGDAAGYFVDGVRTLNVSTIPGLAIENLTAFTGGVPAMYGDISSGAVLITTRGYFSGIREKNVRLANEREIREAEKAKEKAKQDEEKRAKEIEEEKAKAKELKK